MVQNNTGNIAYLQCLRQEPNVENRLGEFQMRKVSWTVIQCSGTSVTASSLVDNTLTRIHQAPDLRLSIVIDFAVGDLPDRHLTLNEKEIKYIENLPPYNLIWAQNSKLDPFDVAQWRSEIHSN